MKTPELVEIIRKLQGQLANDGIQMQEHAGLEVNAKRALTAADLLGVLTHLLEGKAAEQAFGAPDAWGAGTDIGKALG